MKTLHKLSFLILSSVLLFAMSVLGMCRDTRMMPGGVHNIKGNTITDDIKDIARFAVEEHNKKENALLRFSRVLNAKEQVVAGMMYHLTLEAIDAGKRKIYEAKVWVKPWMNFKKLEEFKYSHDGPGSTPLEIRMPGVLKV